MTKINLIIFAVLLGSALGSHAATPEDSINFEIYNKDTQPIRVTATVVGATISPELKGSKVESKGKAPRQHKGAFPVLAKY